MKYDKSWRGIVFPMGTLVIVAALVLSLIPRIARAEAVPPWLRGMPFDFSANSVPLDKILSGGVPPDGIPALDNPKFVPAEEVDFLEPTDEVIGVFEGEEAKAYPVKILAYHENVNDTIGDKDIAVTFCPLNGCSIIFERNVGDKVYDFGISGLLYNSTVVLYDRQARNLWSQLGESAISGSLSGTELKQVPSVRTCWALWKEAVPDSLVLSTDTGYNRDYDVDLYQRYKQDPNLWFPVEAIEPKFPLKERALGVSATDIHKAYPFSELAKMETTFTDVVNGKQLTIHYDADCQSALVLDENGELYSSFVGYWFAWFAFHPDTEIFEAVTAKQPAPAE